MRFFFCRFLQEYVVRQFLALDAVHRLPIWIFKKIQIGGTYGEIRTKKGIYQKAMVQAVEKYGRFVLQELDCVA